MPQRYQAGNRRVDRYRQSDDTALVGGIGVLGPLTVGSGGDVVGPRDRVVLSVLALRPGDVVSPERLADALWGDDVPRSWSKVVQGCVVRIRKVLGPDAVETGPSGYRLVMPSDDVDAHRFERLARRGHELLTLGRPEHAAHVLGEALALWRGPALADLTGWDAGRIEAERLHELRLDAEEALVDAALRAGRGRDVVADAQARVAEAPLRENRWALLARAQYQAGSQGDALRTLSRARRVLAAELGLDPGAELTALEQAILRQDEELLTEAAPTPTLDVCPYRGLVPYDVADADSYFGRENEVAAAIRRIAAAGVLVVVGASGTGKSSFVRAGVAASLARDGRRVMVVTPGARPIDALTVVPVSGPTPVLVVDQCEEVVTLCDDADERARFLGALAAHAERAPLVVAIRADRLGDVTAHAGFARLVEPAIHLLGAMDEHELRAAIEGPARMAGLLLEPGLVDVLVREVEGEPGSLPLLSHALRTTWEHREGRTLTVAGYHAGGGIRGAVAQSAERLYLDVPDDGRRRLRDLLLRLVAPGADGAPVRTRLPRRVLAADPRNDELVERLVATRLVTSGEDDVELAHEALARAWPRLREWLEDDIEGQRILRHVAAAADTWEAMGRPTSELYRGPRLAQAMAWREAADAELTPTEQDFLEESRAREEADLRTAQEQIRRERRRVRRLAKLVAAVAALALVAAGTSLLAVDQRDRADDAATIAEARRVGAQALVEPSYDRALLLAVEGVRLWDSPETRGNLVATIERSQAFGVIHSTSGRLVDLEVAPEGRHLAVVDNTDTLTLYDTRTRADIGRLASADTSYRVPSFDATGRFVAVSVSEASCWRRPCDEFAVELFDGRDLRPIGVTFDGLGAPAADVALAPDGELVAAIAPLPFSGPDDNIAVWRRDRPDDPPVRLSLTELADFAPDTPDSGPEGWLRFSPDANLLYASAGAATVAFHVATGEILGTFAGAGALALSRDGSALAVARPGGLVSIYDTATGAMRAELSRHQGAVTAAAFSPDGSRVATVSNDETAVVWDASTGARVQVLEGHAGSVLDVAFGEDGGTLYTAGADRSVLLWDLNRSRGLARDLVRSSDLPAFEGVALVSPTGTTVLLAGLGLRIIDVGTGTARSLDGETEVAWAAYHPDGRRVVTVDFGGALTLWDIERDVAVARHAGRGVENRGAVAFTPDGRHVIVADANGVVTEVDTDSFEPTGRSLQTGIEPESVRTAPGGRIAVASSSAQDPGSTDVVFADLDTGEIGPQVRLPVSAPRTNFSPDGRLYAAGGFDGRLVVVDGETGQIVGQRDPVHDGPISWVVFSPDGGTLATMGFDGTLRLADPTTGVPHARMLPSRPNLRSSVTYLDDGHTAVIGYEDGSVVAFETDADAWVDHACAVAGRNLTADEWRDAFGDRDYRQTCPANPTAPG